MNKPRPSLKLRLTLWYLAFFTLLFVLFAVYLNGVMARALEGRLDNTLVSEAATAAGLFADELVEMNGDRPKAAVEAVGEIRLHDSTVAIFEGSQLLAASKPSASEALQEVAGAALLHGESEAAFELPRLGPYGAHAAARRMAAGGRQYLVLALEPLDSVEATLALIRRLMFFALPLLLGLAGLGGYLLSSRSLAPLTWMARQARLITGNNLDTRLEIGNAAREMELLAESFNELLSRLDQSFESMRRFVADASHELRTPIAIIRGEADVALSHNRSEAEYRQSLAIVLDESRRLTRLVDDLLNLARADAGRVQLQVQEFYFNDLLAECCRSVQALAAARKIELICKPGEDITFRGDEELLRRLVVNLLDNAIRYTPPGGRISASLEPQGEAICVRIADTGIGIAPEAVPHVFERFYRADQARSRQDGGFGLGLSIVKWIAESHRGAVELSSGPEAGSTFTVTLPLERG